MSVDLTETWRIEVGTRENNEKLKWESTCASSQSECFYVISSSPKLPGVFLNNCMGTWKKLFFASVS